jgi:hypothetical protein
MHTCMSVYMPIHVRIYFMLRPSAPSVFHGPVADGATSGSTGHDRHESVSTSHIATHKNDNRIATYFCHVDNSDAVALDRHHL